MSQINIPSACLKDVAVLKRLLSFFPLGKCYNKKNVSTNRDDFSNPKCVCVGPYTGQLCQVTPCDNLPCFPEVNCSVTSDNYKCGKCPAKFEGDGENCQLILADGRYIKLMNFIVTCS